MSYWSIADFFSLSSEVRKTGFYDVCLINFIEIEIDRLGEVPWNSFVSLE